MKAGKMTETGKSMSQAPKKRVGRPSKGKRANFTFRLTDALRSQLADAAEVSGLSMSEEIERRLDQSFRSSGIVSELFGGPEIARLMQTFSIAALMVEHQTGRKFTEDEATNLAVKDAIIEILGLIKTPPADPSRPPLTLANLGNPNAGSFVDHFAIGTDAAKRAVTIARNAVTKAQSESQTESDAKSGASK
jgi:hypothetical protein